MKTTILSVLAALTLFVSSCASVSPCYSVSMGKGAPTPVSKGTEAAWGQKASKTPYAPAKAKKSHKKVKNYYATKWYDRW